ncbi:MAG: hypoxanthine phosphoribosyltransferase [Tannerella sp.]|jgi:hypoxanthine phosphoribosyltransferase|nr:hypoxanthine phosphoribosyltransferase [Tannerella sp.]
MQDTIRLKDREFSLYIRETEIVDAITRIAAEIERDVQGKNPLFVGILNGAYMFVAELMSKLPPVYELTFAAYSSYRGVKSEGIVKELLPVRGDAHDRIVVLLEDVIDTGLTMQYVMHKLKESGIRDVRLATMLFKPGALRCDLKPDYVGLEIGNDFIVGFGLDYDGLGRTSRNIYRILNNNK